MYGGYLGTGDFQRFAGSAGRGPDAGLTLMLLTSTSKHGQVNSLGARAQSCVCWTSEAQATAGAREPILEILCAGAHFGNLLVNFCFHMLLEYCTVFLLAIVTNGPCAHVSRVLYYGRTSSVDLEFRQQNASERPEYGMYVYTAHTQSRKCTIRVRPCQKCY